MIVLGIESTCDETGIAVVENGDKVFSNVLGSSVDILRKYGGVVPEVAAREQVKVVIPLAKKVLGNFPISKIDSIAVSYGPGLVGSLLVGVETAKVFSLTFNKPLIAVNHLVGHFYSSFLNNDVKPKLPAIGLIVSGGHTDLVLVKKHGEFEHLGGTLDDAAGEAFDKVARFLKLPYPGGPEIEKAALNFSGDKKINLFTPPMINSDRLDFSFSGLKTAVVSYVARTGADLNRKNVDEISYFFQKACIDVLVNKTLKAARNYGVKSIVMGGGVAANESLKTSLTSNAKSEFAVFCPEKKLAVDNGAMIAAAAFYNQHFVDPLGLNVDPSLHF